MSSIVDSLLAPGALSVVFQPMFELNGGPAYRVHAVEGLVRGPAGTHFEPPSVLFEYMRLKRAETRADLAAARAIFAAARELPAGLRFSLNLHAATLSREPEFLVSLSDLLSMYSIEPERVTIEIVEHVPEWALRGLTDALQALRQIGMRIAVDHVGRGQANFALLLQTRPDYLKLDRAFVAGVHADVYRMAVLEASVLLARRFGARVVAEGVEEDRDLETILGLGIDLAQGYLLMRAAPADSLADVLSGGTVPGPR